MGLKPFDRTSFKLDTLIGAKDNSADLVKFHVQSLESNELFCELIAVVNEPWSDDVENLPHKQFLNGLKQFEDVNIFTIDDCMTVDVIIGNDNAFLMWAKEERIGESFDEPHAIHTPLGWLASGGVSLLSEGVAQSFRVQTAGCVSSDSVDATRYATELEKRDREILTLKDTIKELSLDAETVVPSRNDVLACDLVKPNVRVKDNRFEIPVPLKSDISLPNNFVLASDRLADLRKKALKQPEVCEFLIDSMKDLKSSGYIESSEGFDAKCGQEWYLPYFVTSQAKKRIVYDGKAKFRGVCVNDAILSGPDLLNSLVGILMRFRFGEFALMADVTKCYFQIGLPEAQRDLFRILWYENDDVEHGRIVPFRFCVHPWGLKSSSFIACLAIRKIVEQNATCASALTCITVVDNMYMDDFIFSVNSLEEARQIAGESVDLFKSRGFKLVKWSANKQAISVLNDLNSELLAPAVRELDLDIAHNVIMPSAKTLGCVWDTDTDQLRIQCNLKPLDKYTRRNMLSQLGQNWDPLGFCGPYFIQARLILQQLAIEKFDWDTAVPDEFVKGWNKWLCSIQLLSDFALPRWYFANSPYCTPNDEISYELHGFSDASNQAFCSVIYLRRIVNGEISLSFVIGKCTLVLANQFSWPIARKELAAALNTAKLMKSTSNALNISECSRFFWCDSKTVLQWIKNPDLRLNKFITRRVDHILLLTKDSEWHFCAGNVNAADVGTRPDLVKKAEARDLWLNGPTFLHQEKLVSFSDNKSAVVIHKVTCSVDVDSINNLIETAPSLYVLQKRVSYLIAFVEFICCKAKHCVFERHTIDAEYLEKALKLIVKYVQNSIYGEAMKLLLERSPDALDEIIKRCSMDDSARSKRRVKELRCLKKFRPCVDRCGLLRIEGRLSNAHELSFDAKHPLVLPSRNPLTRLVVLFYHQKDEHCGVQHTLLLTRQKFWIVNGNASVKAYLRECGVCSIKKAKPIVTLMSDLPISRTTAHNKPFFESGLDHLGPLTFVEGRSHRKVWGLLFTCMACRAIHVELVTSLSLSEFILAFTRFIDLRGEVQTVHSDNGSTFQAASKKLPELYESSAFQKSLRQKGINWQFIPPYAPSQGGSWEAMVKQFKIVLGNILEASKHKPNFIELLTYTGSAVRIVNERPLTPLSDDPNDFSVITPASLLTPFFDPYSSVGEPHDRDMLRKDYRFNVALSQIFWDKWIAFYLPWLQGRKKWQKLTKNLKPGQLVVLGSSEDIAKRGRYRIGRVHEVIPQFRNGEPIVRRARIAIAKYDEGGKLKIDYVLRDISCLALVENT